MSSDDEFDAAAYKAFEDQLYEEQSLSGLVMFWFCCSVQIFFFLLSSNTGSGFILSLDFQVVVIVRKSIPYIIDEPQGSNMVLF